MSNLWEKYVAGGQMYRQTRIQMTLKQGRALIIWLYIFNYPKPACTPITQKYQQTLAR